MIQHFNIKYVKMPVVSLYTDLSIKEIADLLKKADPNVDIGEHDYDAWGFETTSTKEQIKSACMTALSNVSITVFWGNEVIYDNYICERCGTNDKDNHGYPCGTTVSNCHCYNPDDEI